MAKKDWKPKSTHVVVMGLGLNDWADPDDPSWRRHATLADMFRKAGVPDEQVTFVEDDDATPKKMRKLLPKILANADEDALFVFYYAGHGGLDEEKDNEFYFVHPTVEDDALYGHELIDMLEEHYTGCYAVLLADCCYSGALARKVEELDTEGWYAALTSATSDIESTGNWTFTDCLLDALRGAKAIDENGDGTITFQELADYVVNRMETEENQPSDYAYTSDFDPEFRLALVR
ncbi:MAG: caspase family protein [Polyangiaceae bacterium]